MKEIKDLETKRADFDKEIEGYLKSWDWLNKQKRTDNERLRKTIT